MATVLQASCCVRIAQTTNSQSCTSNVCVMICMCLSACTTADAVHAFTAVAGASRSTGVPWTMPPVRLQQSSSRTFCCLEHDRDVNRAYWPPCCKLLWGPVRAAAAAACRPCISNSCLGSCVSRHSSVQAMQQPHRSTATTCVCIHSGTEVM